MRQAKLVDISRYWRTGGTDWERLKANFDGVVICAGVGFREDVLLQEHVGYADEYAVPYGTYHIPDPLQNMKEQANFYAELSGVPEHVVVADWEIPYVGSREATADEMFVYLTALYNLMTFDPWIYSRWEILERKGPPSWLSRYKLWIARYFYNKIPIDGQYIKYRYFEPFFDQRAWAIPPVGVGYESNVIGWQFTDYGDARFYCANKLTKDPIYLYGMTSADLNVSIGDHETFLDEFIKTEQPEDDCTKICSILQSIVDFIKGIMEKLGC